MEIWNEVFSDIDFANKVLALEPAEAQKVLAEKGYDFTLDEILAYGEEFNATMAKMKGGELSEEDLADVAGGCKWCLAAGIATGIVLVTVGW